MVVRRTLLRAGVVVLLLATPAVWFACSDSATPAGPAAPLRPTILGLSGAFAAQRRHTPALLDLPGVVGTAVAALPDGNAGVLILTERQGVAGLPQQLDGVPVAVRVTGRIMAFSDPTKRQRPAPSGYSVGHPAITAGSIGARVRDALGHVYILSNNHVLANSNNAVIGDPEYQPGPYDGGTAADQIATLTDFQTINFSGGNNTIDAAIALSTEAVLDNATPADEGYGMPNSTIYGDANGDGLFDDRNALLGLNVQKYGRTTHLTHGQISGVNATVDVCYEVSGLTCIKQARYVDQIIISPSGFSGGGDSGSLIVTDDTNLNPVALLFAGSSTVTIANRIDLVLNRFGVTIDGFAPPPPGPLTDLAVTSVSGPSTAVRGSPATISVIVKNVGNQDVSSFGVTLRDSTEHVTVGTQTVAGLAAGIATTLTFTWAPATTGDHTLVATQTLSDDRAANDQRSTTIPVEPPLSDIAVSSVSTPPSGTVIVGHGVNIGVTVTNTGNLNVTSDIPVTLRDSTSGSTLGTQTIAGGLAVGASRTLAFPWNTTGASIGIHRLVATHALADDNAANNRASTAISVIPKPTDIATTGITAPRSVAQGDTAHVIVTVQNVGEVDVGTSFAVVLTDGWDGPTLATGTVNGLAIGASTNVDIAWNTAGAAITGHTVFATQQLADDEPSNNSIGIVISVTSPTPPPPPPPPPPSPADLAMTGISAPARVNQGDIVPVTVTVKNVGGFDVTTNFDVVLTDGSAGNATLGTQTVAGLAAGASTTLTINWNTSGASLSGHTLFATQKLADNNSSNNSIAISVIVQAPPTTDLAVNSVTGPATVTQGSSAAIVVSVQNVGGLTVSGNFDLVLTDATTGVTIGTQTIPGLTTAGSTSRTFNWNTTGAALGGHTLVAKQTLTDVNAANDQGSMTITVNAPSTDVAVTSVTAPGSINKGGTATIGVTVQNVGGLSVGSFNIVLSDATAGVTIGTQTVTSLAVGATAARSFNWNTATAALGGHTLVATQSLTDDNAANNQRSATVNVVPAPADIALASITAPGSVTVGDTAPVVVTVQNVGGQDVTANFDVVLTDGTAGNAVVGTQTIPGLALGASATRTFPWNTAGAVVSGHILTATQKFPDGNSSNNAAAIAITVNPPSEHVGNLDGSTTSGVDTWTAIVRITAHDSRHNPLNGVTVRASWNSGPEVTCVTADADGIGPGTCTISLAAIPNATRSAYFGINGLTMTGYTYKPAMNHDPDGSSNGYSIFVRH